MSDLGFARSLFGDWETTMYTIKHCSRAAFARPMQEFLCAQMSPEARKRSATECTASSAATPLPRRLHRFLGGYTANLPFEALSAVRDMDSPSRTILGLDGMRFVCVREVGASAKLRTGTSSRHWQTAWAAGSRLRSPRSVGGRDVSFLPHSLFVATNVVVEYDEAAGPSGLARKKLIRFP